MHNRVPQMGYFHKGLGTYVYNEPQMGNIFSDLSTAFSSGIKAIDPKVAIEQAKDAAMKKFLETGTGQAAVEDAKQTWLQEQAANAKKTVVQYATKAKENPMVAIGVLAAIGAVVYVVATRRKGQSPAQALAAANPFRKRRKHSKKRRTKRRRK